MQTLKVFKSSAGSGKTFTLVTEYLKLVLKNPEDYKAVLAITFTNKAAEEMKSRIVEALISLSNNEASATREILSKEISEKIISQNAFKVLKNILHDYSSFSVSTIDSFFQRILRALAREIHLPLNMDVQVELDDAILDVTDRLLREVGVDADLTEWLTDLALQKMDDDKGWNIEKDIDSVARELFKEDKFPVKSLSREEIKSHYKNLLLIKRNFENRMKEFGEHVLDEFNKNGLSVSDFSYAEKGVANYFRKITRPGIPANYKIEGRVLEAVQSPEKWVTKKHQRRDEILALVEAVFLPRLSEIAIYVHREFTNYATAVEILRKIFLFGIVNDLQKKFSAFRNENSIILLSDTTKLLGDVISGSDTPFIYEKTGNRFKHLLIDEFQDTSGLQWKNLLPLIINTLGSGFTTLIVGDAKQSIYRWRGGNMNLLLKEIFHDLSPFRSLLVEAVLTKNFRSKEAIVHFNNQFFSIAPNIANEGIKMNNFPALQLAYGANIIQHFKDKNADGGYVQIKTFENEEDEEGEKLSWKETAMKESIEVIRDLLNKGYKYKDICILVRKNSEGNDMANQLFDSGIENIVSPDSLLITSSPKITFLINVFRFLHDNSNTIARSEILYFYSSQILQKKENLHELFKDHFSSGIKRKAKKQHTESLFEGLENNRFNEILPESFTAHITYLGKLPVYELSEQLITIFKLNTTPDAYIQRFHDLVLEYSVKSNSSLEGFLMWWDSSKKVRDTSVIIPENTDAIRIMTIHRSKGLQFPVVIMPFADWQLLPKANELLWLKTQGSNFEELGAVAVSTSARLLDTFFKEEYEAEINQTVIDNLNLLYVAFTRAEERLFVFCSKDNQKNLNTTSKLIGRTCSQIDTNYDGNKFEQGENDVRINYTDKSEPTATHEYLASYPSTRWQDKLALTTRSGNLLSILEDTRMTKINYGILIHDILASVQKIDETDSVIESKMFEGLIPFDEKEKLKNEIAGVLAVPEIRRYFDPEFSVLAEREIVLPDGEVLRPDRVLIKDNAAIVVDFKTGKREKHHEEQVNRYANVLRSMNYEPVEAGIIYLAEKAVQVL